jgi:glycosyltransferase involved in cell wall biosynthesis
VRPDHRALVSAIIPVYNGERYLADAIRSVLEQEHRPLELIVVDDGSSDGSAAVARAFPDVRYHYQPNGGIGAARNRGLELAQGTFIAFLDADDVWPLHKLALQVQAFIIDPGLDIVSGHVEQFHSPELDETVKWRIRCPSDPLPGHAFGAMLIKRESFLRVGPVSIVRTKAECVDWCLRAAELGLRLAMLADVVLRRRLHEDNHGIQHRQELADYAHALKASLDRRRSAVASRFQERGRVYAMHGAVERPATDSFVDRNMLDRETFARFLAKRPLKFGSLEQAIDGASDALTIDDATNAAFDAALLARESGHGVVVFLNPFNLDNGAPYWFCLLDVVLSRTSSASYRFEGHDIALSHPAGKKRLHSAIKSRICALPTEETQRTAILELAESLGVRDLELPTALASMSRRAVEQLVAAGVRIENHGWTHRHPDSGPPEAMWRDIARGQSWLRQHLGIHSRAYAVPFGESPPPAGMPEHLVDMWYLARSQPIGRVGEHIFNRSTLEPGDILT